MKLGPTLVATLACALAFAAANTPADVAPQGAWALWRCAPQGGRVLVGIDGGRPGSWLFASDDAGTTWRTARGLAGAVGRDGDRVCAGQPLDRVRGRHHTALGSSRQRVLRLERRRDDVAGTRLEVDGRDLPAATPGRDRHHRRRSAPAAHGLRRHARVLRRSLNGGASWAVARAGLPPTLDIPSGRTQQLAAGRGGTLYYATGRRSGPGQVYRSVNRGASWQPAGLGLPPVVPGWSLLALAGDATRGGLIYAATGRGLYLTTQQRAILEAGARRSFDRRRDGDDRRAGRSS